MKGCFAGAEIARFVDGGFAPDERERLDLHRATCARCRVAVDEMRAVVADLARAPLPSEAQSSAVLDLGPLVLGRAALPPPRRRWWRGGAALVAAASFGLVAGVALSRHPGGLGGLGSGAGAGAAGAAEMERSGGVDEAGFQRRGGGESPDAWVAIHPYAVSAKRDGERARSLPAERGIGRIACDDRLLFAYDNAGPRPYSHLMIFSVDEAGRFQWFFPEKKAGAGSIAAGEGRGIELHEEVPLEGAGAARRLYALFSRAPLSVEEVERATLREPIGGGGSSGRGRLPFPDTGQHWLRLAACAAEGQE